MDINECRIESVMRLKQLYELMDYKSVIELSDDALKECKELKNATCMAEINQLLSKIYFNKGDYGKAMSYALTAAQLLEQVQAIFPALENINCFAKILIKSNRYREAIKFLKQGLNIANRYDVSLQLTCMFNLIGEAYMGMKELDTAEGCFKNALDIAQNNGYDALIPEIKINIAQLNVSKGVFNIAKSFLDDALIKAEHENQVIFVVWCYLLNANISFERKNYEATIRFAKKAELLAEKNDLFQELASAYEWLYIAYPKQNQFENAYNISQKYIKLLKEINSRENENELHRMQIEFDLYQHQKEMKTLKANYEKVTQQREELQYLMDILGKQNEDLLSVAINDFLTGTYNRKYFMFKFEEEFSIAEEHGRAISCLVFDIDRFKTINDTYGHLAGDEVMKHVVDICVSLTQPIDIIGRFGGDEFVIILMGKGLHQAKLIGDEIIEALRKTTVKVEGSLIEVSVSMGVTDNLIGQPHNAEDMIRIADKALYRAKDRGRNQLCVADECLQGHSKLEQ